MNRDSLSCWPYGVLLTIVAAIVPFAHRFDSSAEIVCYQGDPLHFELPDIFSGSLQDVMLELGELISMEQLNLQLHAATVGVLLLIVHEIVKYKNYHVTFWSVLPTLSFAFHPLRMAMLQDRCGLPFTSSLLFASIAVLGYLRMLFSITSYGSEPSAGLRNTFSSVVTLGKMCLIVACLLAAIGFNRVAVALPIIMLAYHLMAAPRVAPGAGLKEDWRSYRHLSLASALCAVIVYCCARLPMRGNAEYFSTSLAEAIASFGARNEIARVDGNDPLSGLCTHTETSCATNTVVNMVSQSCLDIFKVTALMVLPDVRNLNQSASESAPTSAMLLLHGVQANLDSLSPRTAWIVCTVFFGSFSLLFFCTWCVIKSIVSNYLVSDSFGNEPGKKAGGNGFSAFAGFSRFILVCGACVFFCHCHFVSGLFPVSAGDTQPVPLFVRPEDFDAGMTPYISYLSYFPSALLTVYLSK